MCLADMYKEREPLPALVTFPTLDGIQDVMGFRLDGVQLDAPRAFNGDVGSDARRMPRRDLRVDAPALVCSSGMWTAAAGKWRLRTPEREYCRVVDGSVRIADHRGRQWVFTAGNAFLLLRGFEGELEIIQPARIVYTLFSLPEGCALDWCMAGESRTALGQEKLEH